MPMGDIRLFIFAVMTEDMNFVGFFKALNPFEW